MNENRGFDGVKSNPTAAPVGVCRCEPCDPGWVWNDMQQGANVPHVNEAALIIEKPKRSLWNRLGREEVIFLLFVFPNIALFALFTFWPMVRAFYLSGVRWDMI
jgi:hypothetical protein